jgi:Fic family protein
MKGDWTSWLTFFFVCVIESADDAIGLITALDRLRAEFYARMQAARSSVLLIKFVDALFARPATTIADARKLLGVTPATASASIRKLEDAGILREITGRTRDRVYVSPPILDLMTDRQARPAHSQATR